MKKNKFYVTTPIYYVNDVPHIGHAYTTIAADILARYNRLKGKDVFFLTGTDEHGQKVDKAAQEKGKSPKEHADILVENFKALWVKLNITNDAFIRTTDSEHKERVQAVLQELWDKGEIEKRSYSGWYCTPDERFWTEKDLVDGNCPECNRPVEQIHEENYFFLMSKYQDKLIKHIENNPSFILPETRRNEVLGFLNNNELGDLCISRPKSRLSWGITLPFDEVFVTYVWFDALLNYYTGPIYLSDTDKPWWPAEHHLVGKDILTTHAVYWSTMLMARGWELPKNIFAHGWWTVDGQKMSKSIGNVVDPNKIVDEYGLDAFRYFLFREVTFGLDGNFSEEALAKRTNSDLANDIGNLLSRTLTMIDKYRGGSVPAPVNGKDRNDLEIKIKQWFDKNYTGNISRSYDSFLEGLHFNNALSELWKIMAEINEYIAASVPWKEEDDETLSNILYTLAESLRIIAIYLYPFMPDTAGNIWKQLGLDTDINSIKIDETSNWGGLKPGTRVQKGEALFPRIDLKKKFKKEKTMDNTVGVHGDAPEKDNLISINDFAKVELKIGIVLEAEPVEKSNKLLKLQVDTGEKRQIVAGIAKAYTPEELTGKKVVVVTNLKPAKLMGVESNGMLLAATDSEGVLSILIPEKDINPGASIR
ncbi:methionine--tRNA ligase [bacterium BMS3Abin09]|nr:methionine--tRNA ligase [bacterium BMS3Abin09]GBE41102.1 methionine--tRNA ligase [bacterium BMS3Bbin09]HDH34197.1 methionine--tRNA ligase [Nitrospirota bacterium]HDN94708.1 methionine--tRNA ligase [Nitrospirota bacterium]